MKKIDTIIISGFPATGKSYFNDVDADYHPENFSCDSDSSTFCKSDFPSNYIESIKSKIGIYKYVFISSHKEVRDALVYAGIPFTLVYPSIGLKDEYLLRLKNRGSNADFIKLIDSNWDNWLTELINQRNCKHIVLGAGEYMSNVNLEQGYSKRLNKKVVIIGTTNIGKTCLTAAMSPEAKLFHSDMEVVSLGEAKSRGLTESFKITAPVIHPSLNPELPPPTRAERRKKNRKKR